MSKIVRNQQGFTLMELLVVVVILGFLIGMVAPRLGSIIDDSVIDTVCDTNNKGARYFTKLYYDKNGGLPNELESLVNETSTGFAIPETSDGDPTNGAESLADEFVERNNPVLHILNTDEADELKALGISQIRYLNDHDGSDGQTFAATSNPLRKVNVADGVAVAMLGMGSEGTGDEAIGATAAVGIESWDDVTADTYPTGNPYWIGRIFLGIGKHSSLVTGGYIQAAALCPGGLQNDQNITYNHYGVIIPRLQATVDRMDTSVADQTFEFINADDTSNGEIIEFTMEAQEAWQFDATCPEGHKWPDNDNDYWVFNS
jgi:prepilin-type N-terminal cleavage/methylation domain-containing protein